MLEKDDKKPSYEITKSNAVLDTLFGQVLATEGIMSQ